MSYKMFTTNNCGEFTEREVFESEVLFGAVTATEETENKSTGFSGCGVAITGSSCYNLSQMEPEERRQLLRFLYTEEGLNFGVGRISIGASDYSAELYTYCDTPYDTELKNFSVERDKNYIIPIIKEILEIKPEIKLLASPWSPPGWMKTGGSIGGGYMRDRYIDCYTEYFVKFIKAYEAEGIPIYAVTPQNEPQTAQNGHMPACVWHPDTEAVFIQQLRKKFDLHGINTKIWCHDHNFYDAAGRVEWCFKEYPELHTACDGIAFHYYEGSIDQTAYLKKKYPELTLEFTEGGPRLYENYSTDWCKWGLMVIKALNYGYSSFTGWNLMLDETGGPNVGPFFCGGLVTRNSSDGALSYSGQYKALRHFAGITPESEIYPLTLSPIGPWISCYPSGDAFTSAGCAVKNSDGTTQLIIVNPSKQNKLQLQYSHKGKTVYAELLPDTLATVVLE